MIHHVVMWRVRGKTPAERQQARVQVKQAFESLQGRLPGLHHLAVCLDGSHDDSASDAVLLADFESPQALRACADHAEHLRVRRPLEGLRTDRRQVDHELD